LHRNSSYDREDAESQVDMHPRQLTVSAAGLPICTGTGSYSAAHQDVGCSLDSARLRCAEIAQRIANAAADILEAAAREDEEDALREAAALQAELAARDRALRKRLVEDLLEAKGRIRIFSRVRGSPADGNGSESAIEVVAPATVLVEEHCRREFSNDEMGPTRFDFHGAFGSDTTQADVFEEADPLVDGALLSGTTACILAYGATGAGKTHTMIGSEGGQNRGLIPRALERLLSAEASAPRIGIQVAEVYLDRVQDLLAGGAPVDPGVAFTQKVSGTTQSSPKSEALTMKYPGSVAEALAICSSAFRRRRTKETSRNDRSSRSHLLVLLTVEGGGRLLLADLAGAERQEAGALDRTRLAEASGINRSLVALGKVIAACVVNENANDQQKVHVPYRDSPLTRLLHNFICADARTLLIAHVTPKREDIRETFRTLSFAAQAGGSGRTSTSLTERFERSLSRGESASPRRRPRRMSCPGAILPASRISWGGPEEEEDGDFGRRMSKDSSTSWLSPSAWSPSPEQLNKMAIPQEWDQESSTPPSPEQLSVASSASTSASPRRMNSTPRHLKKRQSMPC
jgi:hypothetical protein